MTSEKAPSKIETKTNRPRASRATTSIKVPRPPADNRFTHVEIKAIKAALRERLNWQAFRGRARRPAHGMPEGVVGLGFGWKRTNGEKSAINCIRIYVRRKVALRRIPMRLRIPGTLEGIDTDVIPIGKIRAHGAAALQSGTSVGDRAGHRGTLGCIVKDDHAQYLLGSWHVMDFLGTSDGAPVFMPALSPGGVLPQVGQVASSLQMAVDGTTPSLIDAAIATIEDRWVPNQSLPNLGPISQTPANLNVPQDQWPVVSIDGCATQNQPGTIEAVAEDVLVEYYDNPGTTGFLTNQIGIVGTGGDFSQETDSGALVVTQTGVNPVGILVGGGATTDKIPIPHSFASPIQAVLDHYHVTIA
jgi:hypothetical protein